jgi:ribosomal protein S18 acetylase RimI-like enzyme
MTIELRRTTPDDVAELGRICYEAFKDISDKHGFPTDFPTVEFAQQVVGMLAQQEDVYGVAALVGGGPKGSNFINMWGDVAGIGPISVDLTAQGQGIGRMLMRDVIKQAEDSGYEMIRLVQDSFNMQSLALYASLGFDVKEPMAYLALANSASPDVNVRPATADDLDAMDELCKSVYRISRKGEYAALMQLGFPAFVLDSGHIAGYLVGTAIGHGVAENDDVMLALLGGLGAMIPDAHSFVAMRQGSLYRKALAAGHRNTKVVNLMAYGPYEEPQGTYCPSVMF